MTWMLSKIFNYNKYWNKYNLMIILMHLSKLQWKNMEMKK